MKIVTISDSLDLSTGLARVHRHIINTLANQGHEIISLCWHSPRDGCFTLRNSGAKVKSYWLKKGDKEELCRVYDIFQLEQPKLIITCGDYWDFWYLQAVIGKMGYYLPWVSILTLDSDPIAEPFRPLFNQMTDIIVPSKWGKDVLIRDIRKDNINYIPFGIEDIFWQKKEKEKNEVFTAISVGTNTDRKNWPSLIEGWGRFVNENKIKAKLIAHTAPQPPNGYDLLQLCDRHNLKVGDDIEFADNNWTPRNSCTDEELYNKYLRSDIFISLSMNEGFCFPAVESIVMGLPILVNSTSALFDLSRFGGLVNSVPLTSLYGCRRRVPDVNDFVSKIKEFYCGWIEDKLNKIANIDKEELNLFSWSNFDKEFLKIVECSFKEIKLPVEDLTI